MCGAKFVPKDHAATKSHSSSLSAGKRKMRKLADEDWEAAFRDLKDDDDDIEPFLTGAITESFKADSSSAASARPPKQRRRVSPTHPYHGIRQRAWGRWSAEIRDPIKGFRVWIGTFDNAEYAARAYDAEARRIDGTKARTNFPAAPPCSRLPEARRIHGTKARTNIPALPPPCACGCLPSAQCSLSSVNGKDRATESASPSSEVFSTSPSNGRIQLELECCSDDVMESLLALSGLLPRNLERIKNDSCMNTIA